MLNHFFRSTNQPSLKSARLRKIQFRAGSGFGSGNCRLAAAANYTDVAAMFAFLRGDRTGRPRRRRAPGTTRTLADALGRQLDHLFGIVLGDEGRARSD